jgi:flagellar hook-associated protein 3 FlgL
MTGVYPVPTTRTSDLLGQVRLLSQLHQDQIDILRYQSQISTGRRVLTPSDDAPASLRGMALQRLLEIKAQAQVNLNSTQSYLDAGDVALSSVSQLLNQAKAAALEVANTTTSDTARQAAAEEVRRVIEQLTNVGNQNFRGRYLFAGARTTSLPFEFVEGQVVYHGNEGELISFADIDLPYASNVPGSEVFGTYSPGIRGTVDLNPILTRDTPLTDLRGGVGVTQGSIAVSDGITTRVVDISSAATIGDVADLIATQPPEGRTISARVTPTGLVVDIDDTPGVNLTIREVGGGTTAAELGILSPFGAGTNSIVGGDLNPRLNLTTPLSSILGARAIAFLDSPGPNNNLVVEARQPGAALNGVAIQFVDDGLLHASPGIVAGSESASFSAVPVAARAALPLSGFGNNLLFTAGTAGASFNGVRIELADAGAIGDAATVGYNAASRTLTLGVDGSGATTVGTLISAINGEGTFTAAHDPSDVVDGALNPASPVQAGDIGVVAGNTGNSGGDANTVFVLIDPGATTANQVLAALAADATIDGLFTARLEGTDSTSDLAAGNGPVSISAGATTVEGSGAELDLASGIQIQSGANTYTIDFSTAETVEDLLNTLNGSPAHVVAAIDPAGDRITVRTRLSGVDFSIGENGGSTATQLGIRTLTSDIHLSELNHGRGVHTADGTDFTIHRRDGTVLEIDVDGAETLGEVVALINDHVDNQDPLTRVAARLALVGNGIELVDENAAGIAPLRIERTFHSEAAYDLGLVPRGEKSSASPTAVGTSEVLTGADPHPLEVRGAFNSLLRLYDAIQSGDLPQIERAAALMEEDFQRVNFARAEIGARGRSLETLSDRLADEEVQLKSSLSNEIDTDLTDAISKLTAQQATLEATLRLTAQTFQLSLLDFL